MLVGGDQVPEQSPRRLQLLAAPAGAARQALCDRLTQTARRLADDVGPEVAVTMVRRNTADPAPGQPLGVPFVGILQVQTDDRSTLDALVDRLRLLDELGDTLDRRVSSVLVGAPQLLISKEDTPYRIYSFMARLPATSREDFVDHYFHVHANFAERMPHVLAYTQFHVDPEASASVAQRIGLGGRIFDGVSELAFASSGSFASEDGAVAAAEAMEDHRRFAVDESLAMHCTTEDMGG